MKKNGFKKRLSQKKGTVQPVNSVPVAVAPAEVAATADASEEQLPDPVITIKAGIRGKVEFVFQDYKIHCRYDAGAGVPTGASVNGIPWNDPEKPFEMGFTPDFSFAEIYETHGSGTVELSVNAKKKQIHLLVEQSGANPSPYQVSVSMRRRKESK